MNIEFSKINDPYTWDLPDVFEVVRGFIVVESSPKVSH